MLTPRAAQKIQQPGPRKDEAFSVFIMGSAVVGEIQNAWKCGDGCKELGNTWGLKSCLRGGDSYGSLHFFESL